MTARFCIAALALVGCAGPVPVSILTTWDIERATDNPTDETRAIVDEAFEAWGVAWETSSTIDGSLELTLTWFEDGAAGVHGFGVASGDCDKSVTVEPEGLLLAHELGHVFGLEDHDEDAGRIMSHPVLGWDVSDAQIDGVQDNADRFSRCR